VQPGAAFCAVIPETQPLESIVSAAEFQIELTTNSHDLFLPNPFKFFMLLSPYHRRYVAEVFKLWGEPLLGKFVGPLERARSCYEGLVYFE
jgi:hypothetical protein